MQNADFFSYLVQGLYAELIACSDKIHHRVKGEETILYIC